MTGDFDVQPLGTVAKVRSGYAFKSDDMGAVGLPVIKIKNVVPPTVDITDCERVPEEVISSIPRVERFELKEGDTLIAMTGATVGKVGKFPRTHERHFLNQRVGKVYLTEPDAADYRYIYYILSQDTYVRKMFGIAEGSAQANISGSQIESLEVPLPPLAEQKAIAAVLGALDDKIELNRRMNATLEAMARALFQSWFVDFDPVRAKLDGRPPAALDPATAALFPDSFQDSTLGHIPKGWEAGSILRQADLLSGGTPKTDVPAYWNGDVPWASAKDVSQCGEAFLVSTERTITNQGVEESATKIIPANATVVVARGATTGRLTMFGHAMAMNQTCYGLRSKVGAPLALYCNARHFIERLVQGGHGSIFDTITTSTFEATDVLLAPKEVLLAFDKQVTPLFQLVHANLHQSRTLATLRDTLLPKLLSGELSVAGVERTVEPST